MDPIKERQLVNRFFEVTDGVLRVAKCKECAKSIVLRRGSIAVTRLLSHAVVVHGASLDEVPVDSGKGRK